ncbi:hypothetical protein [Providencia sp.]|uniref:hypothetical protein n=1 Tax=Providencia sp. TaxID=589 RepID=UPI00333E892E
MPRIQNEPKSLPNINTLNHPKMVNNDSQLAPKLNSVHSSGVDSVLPKSNIKNEINISGCADQLHVSNHQQQIENITKMFVQSGEDITHDMVAKALNAGGHGSVQQQELNLRPESALVILTLLESNDISPELLSAAAELVKTINRKDLNNEKDVKNILSKKQKDLDKKLDVFLSNKGTAGLKDIASRYQDKYVSPAIKALLGEYFSNEVIESQPVDKFLVTSGNAQLEECISKSIAAYHDIDDKHYGDKYQHLNNIFRSLESKIGVISPLKVKMNLNEPVNQDASKIPENKMNDDEVDSFPHQSNASSAGNISNSYNTTTINNFYGSSFPESIKQVSQQESTINQEQEQGSYSSNKTENVNVKPFENDEFSSQNIIKLPHVVLETPIKEPSPDYDFPNNRDQNDQEIDTVKPQYFIEPSNVSGPWKPSSILEEETVQSTINRFKARSESAQKNSQRVDDIKPKMGGHYGSYLIDNKVPNGVKLTNNREFVQNKSTGQTETESNLAIKNASHYRTSYISQDDKVVLSAEGLMTRNLNEKLVYGNKP